MRYAFVFAVLLFCLNPLSAQKPVALKVLSLFHAHHINFYSPFNPSVEAKEDVGQYVNSARMFTIQKEVLQDMVRDDLGLIQLALPAPSDLVLDLYRTDIYSSGAMIKTSDGQAHVPNPDFHFYRGIIHDRPNSLAVVSIVDDKIQLLVADPFGNRRIQQTPDGSYVMFFDKDIAIPKQLDCYVDESATPNPVHFDISDHRQMTGNCVEVYVEADYQSFQDNGYSVSNTEAWIATLFNEVLTLYENEEIPVSVSDVFVYTSPDPFALLSSTNAILTAFTSHIDTLVYDGRLAHFLSTRALGGGIAWIDAICSTTHPTAVSTSLSTTIVPFPTYSWNVEVVTHEMGHNMGSYHTHACVWNNNNTQIDDCGNVYVANYGGSPEGSACFNPNAPILPANNCGTIMSYCHLISSVGINFNLGFGTQPGNVIRNRYNSASCITGSCSAPTCSTLIDPSASAANVDINNDISWASSPGATGYRITIGTTPTNGNIANNLDVGPATTYNPADPLAFNQMIYVKVVPYNQFGDAIGCTAQSFTTEGNVVPQCTSINSPVNGATGVSTETIIHWAHAVGNQTGYFISIGTTPNGVDIINHLNVGNNNFYDHPTSYPYATTLYIKINPYWINGEIACSYQSFTTFVPPPGDFCSTAIELPCGAAIAGTTVGALADLGMPYCGTSIDAPGIWFKFTGNGQNAVLFTCTQYNFDTKLNAYSGNCNNLVCVTGIDDFCAQGSQISFPTTNGTTYYILVQGWNGAQGSFTLSRTCYSGPFYCQSSGYFATLEWIKTVAIGTFSKTSAASSYSDFTIGDSITLSRGGTYTLTLTPQFPQNSRMEYYAVWADLNQDGDFVDSEEQLFTAGPSAAAVTGTITIPITANTGVTRLRVTMCHVPVNSSCGTFANGEVEDYKLKIKCNIVTSTADFGNGSLRNVSFCADDGENILFAPELNGQVINVTAGPITVNGVWKWMPAQGTNIQIKAGAGVTRILSIPAGKSAEIQYLNLTGGIASLGNAIENFGTLILRSCELHPAMGNLNPPLRNAGTTTMIGANIFKF